jgi:hypothetical protein
MSKIDSVRYNERLRARKLYLRMLGWIEQPNVHRCGKHWVHNKYNDSFSLKEAEKIIKLNKLVLPDISGTNATN